MRTAICAGSARYVGHRTELRAGRRSIWETQRTGKTMDGLEAIFLIGAAMWVYAMIAFA
ncbi:MAG: hypothetical protein ABI630_02260 [Betaproteobacteria bacterium]